MRPPRRRDAETAAEKKERINFSFFAFPAFFLGVSASRRSYFVSLFLAISLTARAEFPTTHPYQPITYTHELRVNPNMSLFITTIDLADPRVQVRVVLAGPDPDGPGPWHTSLMTVREIAEREKFDVAVNASFFALNHNGPIAEEKAEQSGATAAAIPQKSRGYVEGAWATPLGQVISDGQVVHADPGSLVIWIDSDHTAKIGMSKDIPPHATQAVSGNCYLVKAGQAVDSDHFGGGMAARNPRTAVGIDQAGKKMILLVVDGRRPWSSIGMTGNELAAEMLKQGCYDAINLDGGGSSTLVMRDPSNEQLQVINEPSDSHERPVSDALGIIIKPEK